MEWGEEDRNSLSAGFRGGGVSVVGSGWFGATMGWMLLE